MHLLADQQFIEHDCVCVCLCARAHVYIRGAVFPRAAQINYGSIRSQVLMGGGSLAPVGGLRV